MWKQPYRIWYTTQTFDGIKNTIHMTISTIKQIYQKLILNHDPNPFSNHPQPHRQNEKRSTPTRPHFEPHLNASTTQLSRHPQTQGVSTDTTINKSGHGAIKAFRGPFVRLAKVGQRRADDINLQVCSGIRTRSREFIHFACCVRRVCV